MPIKAGTALALSAPVVPGTVSVAAPARADHDLRLLLDALSSDVRTLAPSGARGWDDDDQFRRGWYDDDCPSFNANNLPERRPS